MNAILIQVETTEGLL